MMLPTLRANWAHRSIAVAVLLAAAVAISPNVADPDLWGHVQYGRDLLESGLPTTTTYSYSAIGHRWINHENFAEILLAVGIDTIGPVGLLVVKSLLGTGLILLIIRHALRQNVDWLVASSVALLVAVALAYHWSLRPQLLTYLCYASMLWVLAAAFAGWEGSWRLDPAGDPLSKCYSSARLRLLWLVPLIMLVWTNSHGGFVAGFCLFTAYMGCRGVEAIAMYGRRSRGLLARFSMMVVATALVTFINPYGPHLHGWLRYALSMPRPEIVEWHPPDLSDSMALPLWLLIGAWFVGLVFTRRSRDFTHLVLLALTLWQSLEHQRHIPFFAIALGFWMPIHLDSVWRRWRTTAQEPGFPSAVTSPAVRWACALSIAAVYLLLGAKLYGRLHALPVERQSYPVSALEYIADQKLTGRMVVTMNWAQYVIGAFAPKEPVALHEEPQGILVGFDGRFRTCYPQEVVDMHFDFVLGEMPGMRYRSPKSPPFSRDRVLEYGRPDLVLLNRFQPHSAAVMRMHRGRWVLLYQDAMAEIWGRADKYDRTDSPYYLPPAQRRITDEPQIGTVSWPAFPERTEVPPARRTAA